MPAAELPPTVHVVMRRRDFDYEGVEDEAICAFLDRESAAGFAASMQAQQSAWSEVYEGVTRGGVEAAAAAFGLLDPNPYKAAYRYGVEYLCREVPLREAANAGR